MGYGLFGKVPQKRDFMSVQMPTAVLSPFETWLQSAVAASRNELGQAWQDHYLTAPIWRFWIGEQILGTRVAGALMPSVDQVGRYFPLSIMYFAQPGEPLPPPLLDPLDHWYVPIEQRLLMALGEDTDAYLSGVLNGLLPPDQTPLPPPPPPPSVAEPETTPESDGQDVEGEQVEGEAVVDAEPPPPPAFAVEDLPDGSPFDPAPPPPDTGPVPSEFRGGHTLEVPQGETLESAIETLRRADYSYATAGRSYFWCAASRVGPARIHARQGMPDPYFFSRMIVWEGGAR